MACLAASMLATFSAAASPTRLTSITSCRLCSLSVFPPLVVRDGVVLEPKVPPLAAIEANVCVDGGDMENGVELRSERRDGLFEFGVLALDVLLFLFDCYEVGSNA